MGRIANRISLCNNSISDFTDYIPKNIIIFIILGQRYLKEYVELICRG